MGLKILVSLVRFPVAPLEKEVEIISFLFCYIEFIVLRIVSN